MDYGEAEMSEIIEPHLRPHMAGKSGANLVIVWNHYSHLAYPNICIKLQTCENFGSIGQPICKRINNERKHTLVELLGVLSDAFHLKYYYIIWVRKYLFCTDETCISASRSLIAELYVHFL